MSLKRPNKRKNCPRNPLRRDSNGKVTRLYKIWIEMRSRCMNPKKNNYQWYGGKGIKVCDEWFNYSVFHDDMSKSYYSHVKKYGERDTTIDRTDSKKCYCKENCRWATRVEQSRNTVNSLLIPYKGLIKPLGDWCDELGLRYQTIHSRLYDYGFSIEDALGKNINTHFKFAFYKGKDRNIKEISRMTGMNYVTLMNRINKGWSIEKALTFPVRVFNYNKHIK